MSMLDSLRYSILKAGLKFAFPSQILARGRKLHKEGAVLSARMISESECQGVVLGSRKYITNLLIEDEYGIIESECSCPYGNDCKHGAALAYHLLSDKVKGAEDLAQYNKKLQLLAKTFGRRWSGHFRPLPLDPEVSIGDVVKKLSEWRMTNEMNNLLVYLRDAHTVEIEAEFKSHRYFYEDTRSYSIMLQRADQQVLIKCNECDELTKYLCQHQQLILSQFEVQDFVRSIREGAWDYDHVTQSLSTQMQISEKTLLEHFDLRLKGAQVMAYPSSDELITGNSTDLQSFMAAKEKAEQIIDEDLQKLEEMSSRSNAMAWSKHNRALLLEGKHNKDKSALASYISEAVHPLHWDEQLMTVFNELVRLRNISTNLVPMLAFCKENISTVSSAIQYIDTRQKPFSREKLRKRDLTHIHFSKDWVHVQSTLKQTQDLSMVEFTLQAGSVMIRPSEIQWYNGLFLVSQDIAYFYDKIDLDAFIAFAQGRDQVKFLKSERGLLNKFLKRVREFGPLEMPGLTEEKLVGGQKEIHIREVGSFIVFEPSLLYDQHRFSIYNDPVKYDPEEQSSFYAERELYDQLKGEMRTFHPTWDKDFIPQNYLYLSVDQVLDNLWFLNFFEKAREYGIKVFGQEKLSQLKINTHRASVSSYIRSGIAWFEAQVQIRFGDQLTTQNQWIDAVRNDSSYIQLDDGTLGILPENWLKKLKKLLTVSDVEKDGLKLSKFRFNVVDDLFENIKDKKLRKEIDQNKKALANFDQNKKYQVPKKIKATLRPYQLKGYQWLRFLDDFNLGGCLADDMGLGKTLQILSLLVTQKTRKRGTSLVIIPRSLLFNWAAEIEKFTPQLTFLIHHGPFRDSSLSNYSNYDLIISTYDTIVRDISGIKEIKFNYIILDESQAIKNPNSKRYKAMRLLTSRNKLAMTGTPIENNTFDLYAQMSFLNPGLLGTAKHFREHFALPIDNLGNMDALQTLKTMIHPFILRRTKEQVAGDLPGKSESIIYCDMDTQQRKMYEALREKIKEDVQGAVYEQGLNKSKFKILEGLLRLRQICNSPELLNGKLPAAKKASVKIDTLLQLLVDDLGNHSALVFSQFVSMLSLIRKQLDKRKIPYAYLDGSTKDREAVVSEFLTNDKCQIFLISLKAGNTGLNLTKADYVYLIDPWWNPAVETQAIDRTHRIGQDKNVFAYRMICKDTIEEKIVELQQKKKKLAKDLIQVDESVFKSLKKDELLALFD